MDRASLDALLPAARRFQAEGGGGASCCPPPAPAGCPRPGPAAPRPAPRSPPLTPRELQIARLAAQGLTNRDIADRLFLGPRTVAHHHYRAYPKLDITSRTELTTVL
ncbi:helix-turn-helix transcriptional regulator [Kitasatospora sp. NPDC048298]|uniref:helix-turn-helix domain-containing protein n=1 Tax=Kitasatospora sp. NPDC048298 TaxID=3364049 RepID=UPI0037201E62